MQISDRKTGNILQRIDKLETQYGFLVSKKTPEQTLIQVKLDKELLEKNDICGTLTEPSKSNLFFNIIVENCRYLNKNVWN